MVLRLEMQFKKAKLKIPKLKKPKLKILKLKTPKRKKRKKSQRKKPMSKKKKHKIMQRVDGRLERTKNYSILLYSLIGSTFLLLAILNIIGII